MVDCYGVVTTWFENSTVTSEKRSADRTMMLDVLVRFSTRDIWSGSNSFLQSKSNVAFFNSVKLQWCSHNTVFDVQRLEWLNYSLALIGSKYFSIDNFLHFRNGSIMLRAWDCEMKWLMEISFATFSIPRRWLVLRKKVSSPEYRYNEPK